MTNKEIAAHFRALARIMEYNGENPFKIRSYSKAYDLLRKLDTPVAGMTSDALEELNGIGKAISEKIVALVDTGELELLQRYRGTTPPGAVELLGVRGLGPKKVRQLVTQLEVDSIGELLHAIRENRVIELKGFSQASQAKLKQQLEFYQAAQGFARYAELESRTAEFLGSLRQNCTRAEVAGEMRRQLPVVAEILLLATPDAAEFLAASELVPGGQSFSGALEEFPLRVQLETVASFDAAWVRASANPDWLQAHPSLAEIIEASDECDVFAKAGMPYVPAPQREPQSPWPPAPQEEVIKLRDIKGVVHAHTTWSDGATSSEVLAKACMAQDFEYLVITDHSKAAGYAGGLSIDRLRQQSVELRELNDQLDNFTIFRGTECDILRDGTLDYPPDVLSDLDVVIASVHSVLNMSEADATQRVVRAIETGLVDILGHPTGRLLLSRAGYPLNWEEVFAACVAHGTAVELNASPYRLDLDWTLIPKAVEYGLQISINPDAHALSGLEDIRFGVLAAQKAGLRQNHCLNTRSAAAFSEWLVARRA